jgi:hypothetical protein
VKATKKPEYSKQPVNKRSFKPRKGGLNPLEEI